MNVIFSNFFSNTSLSASILFISYDGILEPLGQSQVQAYLNYLAADRTICLISFEKVENWSNFEDRQIIMRSMSKVGILWYPLIYHKRPMVLGTAWDITCGIAVGLYLILRHRLRIVHARSYVPSMMALVLKKITGTKYLFDMRGFWVDERVDAGLWSRTGLMYRVAKWFEKRFLLTADHVVSLTQSAVREIEQFPFLKGCMPTFTVIPTCVDLDRFAPKLPKVLDENIVIGYVGTAGTWYRFEEVAACFAQLLLMRPDARFLILNLGEHDYIRSQLDLAGVPEKSFELYSAKHTEVADHMARMDAGVFFIKSVFSKRASAPTKLAEFLSCGIPCLSNEGIGDMKEVLEGEQVGILLTSFDEVAIRVGLQQLLALVVDSSVRERCVDVARRHFSLDQGVLRYRKIYNLLAK